MTPQEIQTAVRALAAEIGDRCEVSLSIRSDAYGSGIFVHCNPVGYVSGETPSIGFYADDWQEALDGVRTEWAKMRADVMAATIRKMALAIIRITADTGTCSDAALRADKFTNSDIEMYGGDACEQADIMASNGPFRITAVQGANAA